MRLLISSTDKGSFRLYRCSWRPVSDSPRKIGSREPFACDELLLDAPVHEPVWTNELVATMRAHANDVRVFEPRQEVLYRYEPRVARRIRHILLYTGRRAPHKLAAAVRALRAL